MSERRGDDMGAEIVDAPVEHADRLNAVDDEQYARVAADLRQRVDAGALAEAVAGRLTSA